MSASLEEIQKERFQSVEKVCDRIITVSSGVLAVTLTFRSSLVTSGCKNVIIHPWLLYAAWGGLIIALICALLTMLARSSALGNQINSRLLGKPEEFRPHWFLRHSFNVAVIAFVGAFLSFIFFAVANG